MIMLRWVIVAVPAAFLLGVVPFGALAGQGAEPGKGPPDCPGTPGAFISGEAKELVAQGTPPGHVVRDLARGQGVGQVVRQALREDCGIGALPQAED